MRLSEPQKHVLTLLHTWGWCRVHTDLGSISRDRLDTLRGLEEHGLVKLLEAPWSIVFSLTSNGREKAKELFADLTDPEESL